LAEQNQLEQLPRRVVEILSLVGSHQPLEEDRAVDGRELWRLNLEDRVVDRVARSRLVPELEPPDKGTEVGRGRAADITMKVRGEAVALEVLESAQFRECPLDPEVLELPRFPLCWRPVELVKMYQESIILAAAAAVEYRAILQEVFWVQVDTAEAEQEDLRRVLP
jgi:hypothetical protein